MLSKVMSKHIYPHAQMIVSVEAESAQMFQMH